MLLVRCWFALSIFASCTLAATAARAEDPLRVVLLLDRASGRKIDTTIDGTQKRILDPVIAANVVPLPDALPPQPMLSVATGIRPAKDDLGVRFEIAWKSADGREDLIYSAVRGTAGWTPVRVDLGGRNPAGASLVFRRAVTAGPRRDVLRASWGDPIIVAAAKGSAARSVILISLDTLRADHVGFYGHAKARTPALDALGRTGVWYEHAYSASGWTLPSHASLFYSDHVAIVPPDPVRMDEGGTRPPSLADVLRAQGFLTAAFTGGGWMTAGFAHGFDTFYAFDAPPPKPDQCPPERLDGKTVFQQATDWLRDRGRAPFFLFLHTYDVHDRCPFRKPTAVGFQDWSENAKSADMLRFYDDLIAATDGLVGELVAELDRLGLRRTTTIVVTSDHGEFFDEHGLHGHGCVQKAYEELVRVPLIINDPTIAKRGSVTEPVSLVDVAPSILSLLHVPVPKSMHGTTLPGLGLDSSRRAQTIYALCDDRVMVRDAHDKLITSRTAAFQDEVYDLAADPHETKNLASDESRLRRLQQLAPQRQASAPSPSPAEAATPAMDESIKERLRALGY